MRLDMCLDIINTFGEFWIRHILKHEDLKANMLAQQASGFDVGGCNFHIKEKTMQENFVVLCVGAAESTKLTLQSADLTLWVDRADSPS